MSTQPAPADAPVPQFRTEPVSFVRRSERLSPRHQRAMDRYASRYVLDVPRAIARTSIDPAYRIDPATVLGRTAPLIVEIGSGQGEALIASAALRPDIDHLAVEVYLPGVAQTVLRAAKHGLENVRIVQANAPEVLTTALEPASVDELWVFFPDPWPKVRHHKRRLVDDGFADRAARVLAPGGVWRLATDWAEYAGQMRETVAAHPAFVPAAPGDGTTQRFTGRIETNFEKKAIAAGRAVTDLAFRRRD